MPQGLSNSPSTLARLLNQVLGDLSPHVITYLDDFVVHIESMEEHKVILTKVFQALSEAKLQIGLDKCNPTPKRLGHCG